MEHHLSVTFHRVRDLIAAPVRAADSGSRLKNPAPFLFKQGPVTEASGRLCFLDNLRAFVVVCVVALHGSMIYMENPPRWWYVTSPQHSLVFNFLGLLIDTPVMMVMFFIAAYFLVPSLLKRDEKTFLKDKFVRIGLPWIAGVLLLTPPTVYIAYYSRHVPVGFFKFLTADFWLGMYQQSVYWFLGILLLFFILFSLAYHSAPRAWAAPRRVSRSSWKLLAAFWAATTLAQLGMAWFHVPGQWYALGYVFYFQPWRVPLYVGYFVLGILAYRRGWFTPGGYMPRLIPWSLLWILSGVLYVGIRCGGNRLPLFKLLHLTGHPEPLYLMENAILFSTFCLCSLMAGAAVFHRFINGSGVLWRSLSANSYGIYYVHPVILYPLALVFMGMPLPIFLKAGLVVGIACALSGMVSAFVLRKAPLLRKAF